MWFINEILKKYGYNDFIGFGYKGTVVKNFQKKRFSFNVKCIDTGKNTLTGGRLLKLKKYLIKRKILCLPIERLNKSKYKEIGKIP